MGIKSFFISLFKNSKKGSILLLGLDNSGKTSILRQLCEEEIADVTPTQGFSIKTLEVQGVKLQVWDMGGQQAIRYYWRQYFDNAEVLIFVIDSADLDRTREAKEEFAYLMEEDKLSGVPVLIFANKQDLVGALSCEEIAVLLNLEELRDRRWHIQACSALSGEGLVDGLKWIVQQIRFWKSRENFGDHVVKSKKKFNFKSS